METEVSLPHLQVPATCPYTEPDRSNSCPYSPLPDDPGFRSPSNYIIHCKIIYVVTFTNILS